MRQKSTSRKYQAQALCFTRELHAAFTTRHEYNTSYAIVFLHLAISTTSMMHELATLYIFITTNLYCIITTILSGIYFSCYVFSACSPRTGWQWSGLSTTQPFDHHSAFFIHHLEHGVKVLLFCCSPLPFLTEPEDYGFPSSVVYTFRPRATRECVDIPIVNDNLVDREFLERFFGNLIGTDPASPRITLNPDRTRITIVDHDDRKSV